MSTANLEGELISIPLVKALLSSPDSRSGSLPPLLGRGMNPRPAPATCRSLCQRKLVQVQASIGIQLDPPTIGSPRHAAGHMNRSSFLGAVYCRLRAAIALRTKTSFPSEEISTAP